MLGEGEYVCWKCSPECSNKYSSNYYIVHPGNTIWESSLGGSCGDSATSTD